MARPLRIEYPGAYYHVMNRGLAHTNIFLNDKDRERFLVLIGETCQLWGLEVYAYCLMGNHYHLLVQTPTVGLSRAMRPGGWPGEVLIGEHGVFENAGADCQRAKAQAPSPTN